MNGGERSFEDGQYGMIPGSMKAPILIPPLHPLSLTMFFPCHNEEGNVERVTLAALDVGRRHARDLEVLIVDDGSTDRTAAIADRLAAADPRVRVLHNPVNLKLGGALRAGYAAATKDLIFYTDADLPIDLEEVPRAVRLLEYQQADVVAAYRHDRTSEGWLRTVYTFAYNHLIRILFGLKVRDVNFAFKLFRRSVLGRFPLKSNGSFIDAEFLLRARKHGCPIIQIGLDYFPRTRGQSTLASFGVIVSMLREMAVNWNDLR
jgi:glycosyltransferase involved in cell wall biosynthesis